MRLAEQSFPLERLAALVGLGFFCLVLGLGWVGGVESLVRMSPLSGATMPTTAFSFIVIFGVLSADHHARRAAPVALWLIVALAVFNLICAVLGAHIDLGLWLSPGDAGHRVSVASSICFIVAAWMLFQRRRSPTLGAAPMIVAIIGLSTMTAILAGHDFEGIGWRAVPGFIGMSEYTASGFALFCIAILMGTEDRRPGDGEFA